MKYLKKITLNLCLFFVLFLVFGLFRTKNVGINSLSLILGLGISFVLFYLLNLSINKQTKLIYNILISLLLSLIMVVSVETFAFTQERKIINNQPSCLYGTHNIERWWPFSFNEIACSKNGLWIGND